MCFSNQQETQFYQNVSYDLVAFTWRTGLFISELMLRDLVFLEAFSEVLF